MRAPRRARRVAIAVLGCACAGAAQPAADPCAAAAARPPLPSPECFASDEGQRYAGRLAAVIGETLTGYHSHPGKVELSVEFDAAAGVESVCADWVEGDRVARRLPGAIDTIHELPAAPACFAGRRLGFAWESPEVTREHVRIATRECRREVEGHRRRNLYCLEMQRCSEREVIERWDRGDRELRACVLGKIPLELRLADSEESHLFVPADGSPPDPDRALEALEVCDALGDRAALVGCMHERGWVPR